MDKERRVELLYLEIAKLKKENTELKEHINFEQATSGIKHLLPVEVCSIPIKRISPDARMPEYKHKGDAGFDLYLPDGFMLEPQETKTIGLGWAFEIPYGYEMQLRMRSGISKSGEIINPNGVCTIDAGYRGQVFFTVKNIALAPIRFEKGQRICQGIIAPVVMGVFYEVDELSPSERGDGGHGSTGK